MKKNDELPKLASEEYSQWYSVSIKLLIGLNFIVIPMAFLFTLFIISICEYKCELKHYTILLIDALLVIFMANRNNKLAIVGDILGLMWFLLGLTNDDYLGFT